MTYLPITVALEPVKGSLNLGALKPAKRSNTSSPKRWLSLTCSKDDTQSSGIPKFSNTCRYFLEDQGIPRGVGEDQDRIDLSTVASLSE